jgi:hypothetical protein
MSKLRYKVMHKGGSYVDQNGEEKNRWNQVGSIFESENGKFSMKLELLPVGTEGPLFFSLFEPNRRD